MESGGVCRMKAYLYIEDERGKLKVFIDEFEAKIINNFYIPTKNKKKGVQIYREKEFKQKFSCKGVVDKTEIITKKWWEFWK